MFFTHESLTCRGKLRADLHERVLTVTIQLQVVILHEIKQTIGEGPSARTYLEYTQTALLLVSHLIKHAVGDSVTKVRFKEL